MTPVHPQCNGQVEVFNKIVRDYLTYFVYDLMLDRENHFSALMLAYNTNYHCTISITPFDLLLGANN
jgi:hypothetical protein